MALGRASKEGNEPLLNVSHMPETVTRARHAFSYLILINPRRRLLLTSLSRQRNWDSGRTTNLYKVPKVVIEPILKTGSIFITLITHSNQHGGYGHGLWYHFTGFLPSSILWQKQVDCASGKWELFRTHSQKLLEGLSEFKYGSF